MQNNTAQDNAVLCANDQRLLAYIGVLTDGHMRTLQNSIQHVRTGHTNTPT